jgi:hypothetical protein
MTPKKSPFVIVDGIEIARVVVQLQAFFRGKDIPPTVAAGACLMFFAAALKASGHPAQTGYDGLDRMLAIFDAGGTPDVGVN